MRETIITNDGNTHANIEKPIGKKLTSDRINTEKHTENKPTNNKGSMIKNEVCTDNNVTLANAEVNIPISIDHVILKVLYTKSF